MYFNYPTLFLSLLFILCLSCNTESNVEWQNLLDKDLSQWENYLSFRYPEGYDDEILVDENGQEIQPIGLNKNSEYNVFNTTQEGDECILRISGEIYGCITTKEAYENYHLKLKVKWGDIKYHPRKKLLKDSGIMYHSIGPHGAEGWRSWKLSQEFQIMEGHMGDYWSQATSAIDVRALVPEYIMNPVADTNQDFIPLGEGSEYPGFCLRSVNNEKPSGEWNEIELICFENKSIHIVNGEVVMVLKDSRYMKDGRAIPMQKGQIQIQSEAAEVFYKDIYIRPITALSPELAAFYQ